jgi:ribosomal-protein-alanine N-acetyltransferase
LIRLEYDSLKGTADLASCFTICDASIDDLDTIYEIELECFSLEAFAKWYYRLLLLSSDVVFLKFCVDDEIAGFIVGSIRRIEGNAECTICTVNVRSRSRRRGIATALVGELEKRLIGRDCFRIVLQVRTDNLASIGLFSKLGYQRLRILKNYYALGHDAVEMGKILKP